MELQRTLVLIKPHVFIDFIESGPLTIIADIQEKYTYRDLKIIRVKKVNFSVELIQSFYKEHSKKPFFLGLIKAMTVGPCLAMVLEGVNAVFKVRGINGATNPKEAKAGTLRHDYGRHEKGPNNGVHGSDSLESAEREVNIIFSEIEMEKRGWERIK